MHIVHLFFGDFSIAKGPSVNEREFILAAANIVDDFHAIAPTPGSIVSELASLRNMKFVGSFSKFKPFNIIKDQVVVALAAYRLVKSFEQKDEQYRIVVRLPVFPWAILILMVLLRNDVFFVKSLGDAEFLKRSKGVRKILSLPFLFLQTTLVKAVLLRCNAIDTVTPELAANHALLYGLDREKIVVIPNATNTDRFVPDARAEYRASFNLADTDFVICYAGGKPLERGGATILRAVKELENDIVNVKCLIAGGDEDELLSLATKLGVASRSRIVGRIPYEDVCGLLNAADVLLATDDLARVREFGNSNQKIRQALAVGLPVVSNVYVDKIFLDSKLVLGIDTDDLEEVKAAIRNVFCWSKLKKLSFQALSRKIVSEHFSVENVLSRRLVLWGYDLP